jgi:hypothetical protein
LENVNSTEEMSRNFKPQNKIAVSDHFADVSKMVEVVGKGINTEDT